MFPKQIHHKINNFKGFNSGILQFFTLQKAENLHKQYLMGNLVAQSFGDEDLKHHTR